MSFQSVEVLGNLGRDPEMRYLPDGTAVTNISIAVREYDGETTWFECEAWGKTAEFVNQYFVKGQSIFIRGVLVMDKETRRPRVWEAKDGTVKAEAPRVRAREVYFAGSKGASLTTEAGSEPQDVLFG